MRSIIMSDLSPLESFLLNNEFKFIIASFLIFLTYYLKTDPEIFSYRKNFFNSLINKIIFVETARLKYIKVKEIEWIKFK